MEKQLKFVLLLSLKEIALRRVAVLFWNGSDILASLWKVVLSNISDERWREAIEDKIKDKILKLELPKMLTKQIIEIVRPISLEVTAWEKNHRSFLLTSHTGIALPDSIKLCWTTSGTINYRKTAEELLRCDKLDVKQRYEIACYYCFDDYISLYWEELPKKEKENYINYKTLQVDLPYYWPYILKGVHSELDYLARKSSRNLTSFNQWAFENSAERCRKTAAEYFFQKLTQEEREASLMRAAYAVIADCDMRYLAMEKRSDLMCYLLSLMSPKQQMEIIRAKPIHVFLFFLRWPLRDLFLDNVDLLWTFLPPSRYKALVGKIINRYSRSFFYFPNIFKEFFMESPQDFKKWFVDEKSEYVFTPASHFLSTFFSSGDSESIEVMFRNLDAADRVKLVFQGRVLSLFYDCMREDKWHLVEVCLREAMLSKEEKERLKDAFTGFLEREELKNPKCKRFFEFLDETDPSSDKREKGQKCKLENGSPEQ